MTFFFVQIMGIPEFCVADPYQIEGQIWCYLKVKLRDQLFFSCFTLSDGILVRWSFNHLIMMLPQTNGFKPSSDGSIRPGVCSSCWNFTVNADAVGVQDPQISRRSLNSANPAMGKCANLPSTIFPKTGMKLRKFCAQTEAARRGRPLGSATADGPWFYLIIWLWQHGSVSSMTYI